MNSIDERSFLNGRNCETDYYTSIFVKSGELEKRLMYLEDNIRNLQKILSTLDPKSIEFDRYIKYIELEVDLCNIVRDEMNLNYKKIKLYNEIKNDYAKNIKMFPVPAPAPSSPLDHTSFMNFEGNLCTFNSLQLLNEFTRIIRNIEGDHTELLQCCSLSGKTITKFLHKYIRNYTIEYLKKYNLPNISSIKGNLIYVFPKLLESFINRQLTPTFGPFEPDRVYEISHINKPLIVQLLRTSYTVHDDIIVEPKDNREWNIIISKL